MNCVLARVKGINPTPFLKLLSDYTLYENTKVSLDSCVCYSPDHNLDEDSWFKIELFSQQPYCIDFLKEDFDSKNYNDLEKDKFSKIAYIVAIQDGDFYFQKVTPSLFIKKKILAFGEFAQIEESNTRLIINDQPDAVYYKQADTLIFRNLATITSIFKDIDELYREATQKETEDFLRLDFIELKNSYGANKVSKPNRKRIALAMDSLEKMNAEDKMNILTYINEYSEKTLTFHKPQNKFEISNDNELKLLLYGIEQRFYTTPFGQEKRLANSVININ